MRIVTFCATQNSGKTSIIRELISRLTAAGKTTAVIVNERGKVRYDPGFLRSTNTHIERLRGG